VLDTLVEDDVRVTIDLFGLEPGEYSLPPNVDVFAEELEVRSTDPAQVTVVITDVLTATEGITATLPVTETLGVPAGSITGVAGAPALPAAVPLLGQQTPLLMSEPWLLLPI
jgi:hypothetical protein